MKIIAVCLVPNISWRTGVFLTSCFLLSGCNLAERLSNVGEPPELSQIQDPTLVAGYQPVTMPMPMPERQGTKANSLWETGARAFFKDQRAGKVGDILTVKVEIQDTAKFDSKPNLTKTTTTNTQVNKLMGFESKLKNILPKGVDPTNLINLSNTPSLTGQGTYDRKEYVKLKVAAVVTQILPNGNMVIHGRQEVRLVNEVRVIDIKGIVRREDINSGNMVNFEKIAEARISYGGRGDITDMNEFPLAQQILNKASPF